MVVILLVSVIVIVMSLIIVIGSVLRIRVQLLWVVCLMRFRLRLLNRVIICGLLFVSLTWSLC